MARKGKKEFKFRGKKLEELKQLGIREFAKYITSRERRSILRNFDTIKKFLDKCKKCQEKGKPIRTHNKQVIITPQMIGMTINVYNGKNYESVKINERMLGHRLGEFAKTRKDVQHGAPGIGATRSSASLSVK